MPTRTYSKKEVIVLTILWVDLFETFCSHVQNVIDGHEEEERVKDEVLSAVLSAVCLLLGIYAVHKKKICLLTLFIALLVLGVIAELVIIVVELTSDESPTTFSYGMMFHLLCNSVVGICITILTIALRQEYRKNRFAEPDLEMFL